MNILSIETSHAVASVALLHDGILTEKKICSDKRHEETVMPAVCELLEEQGIEPSGLDLVSVDVGPGSFTGIRIGICHANAIADAADIPCIGISALELMAFDNAGTSSTAVMIDAGNGNCYGAVYDKNGSPVLGPVADTNEAFEEAAAGLYEGSVLKDTDGHSPSAGTLAKAAALRFEKGVEKQTRAQPLYLRPSQAERKRRV